jgi:hypothetical protein
VKGNANKIVQIVQTYTSLTLIFRFDEIQCELTNPLFPF